MLQVKLANETELRWLDPADGFDLWIQSIGFSGKEALRRNLISAVNIEREVWVASDGYRLLGFAILADFEELPKTVVIEALEVARSFRGNGIGTQLMQGMLEKHGNQIFVVELAPQLDREGDLVSFYEKLGFKRASRYVMVLNPYRPEKLREWVRNLEDFVAIVDGLENKKNAEAGIFIRNPRFYRLDEKRENWLCLPVLMLSSAASLRPK